MATREGHRILIRTRREKKEGKEMICMVCAAILLLALAALAVACGGKEESVSEVTASPIAETPTETPAATSEPTQTPSPEPTVAPSPTATLEPTATQSPTPTPTLELPSANPVPGSCLVVEEKYCKIAELYEFQAPWEESPKAIGFRLPVGAALFVPFDGWFGGMGRGGSFFSPEAFTLSVEPRATAGQPGGRSFSAHGVLQSDVPYREMSKGEIIAFIGEGDVGLPRGYNVIIAFYKWTESGQVSDEEMIFQLFPGLR